MGKINRSRVLPTESTNSVGCGVEVAGSGGQNQKQQINAMGDDGAGRANPPRLIHLALMVFSVASATLLLQVTQTRIYSVVFFSHLVYFIISLALLGFGISGTWLAFGKSGRLARFLTLRKAAIGFTFSAIISSLLAPRLGISIAMILHNRAHMLQLLLVYSLAVFPYFFAGWILGVIYRDFAKKIHMLYFADLAGAAVGCLLFLVLIQPLGAVHLTLTCCALGSLPVVVLAPPPKFRVLGTLVLGLPILFISIFPGYFEASIVPEPAKAFNTYYTVFDNMRKDDEKIVELSEYNVIARTDVVTTRKEPHKKSIFIDGDAMTPIVVDPPRPVPPYSADAMPPRCPSYFLDRPTDSFLVIGAGGGVDVYTALRAGAERVDAVEVNPTTVRIMLNDYRDLSNDLFYRPGVTLYNEEGRSFVRRSQEQYDVIVLWAIDTYAAQNAGAYMLSESYLYTVEAVMDYADHLTERGILCIARWAHDAESPRLFTVMLEAAYQLGYENPERHILAYLDRRHTLALLSPTAFGQGEIARLKLHLDKGIWRGLKLLIFPVPPEEQKPPLGPYQRLAYRYAVDRAENAEKQIIDDYLCNIAPVWDDSPFFFNYSRPKDLLRVFEKHEDPMRERGHVLGGYWPSFTLITLLLFVGAVVALFMFLPLIGRKRGPLPHFKSWLGYFACLGIAFIFVEIALMQRFALLLGHPARSLALVLASLLFFAGLGSHLQERLRINITIAMALLILIIVSTAYLYPHIIAAALGGALWFRGVVTIALVAPPAFLMGMPFPVGLKLISQHGERAVPWMWGVNGGATVLGSILAIMCAVHINFTAVLLLAAFGYTVALVLNQFVLKQP